MKRFYENIIGSRDGLKEPMPRSEALREAQHWLRDLSLAEAELEESQLGEVVRGSVRRLKPRVEREGDAAHPFAHPFYWAGFILVGDPG